MQWVPQSNRLCQLWLHNHTSDDILTQFWHYCCLQRSNKRGTAHCYELFRCFLKSGM